MDAPAEFRIHIGSDAVCCVEVNGHAASQIDIQGAAQRKPLLQLLEQLPQAFCQRRMGMKNREHGHGLSAHAAGG